MALPFLNNNSTKRPDQMLSIDLGGRNTKAVFIQRKGNGFSLVNYALIDAPIYDKSPSAELLSEHFRAVAKALELKSKPVTLSLGANDSMLRPAEMPTLGVDDLRQMLKISAKTYLQQEYTGHVFDVAMMSQPNGSKPVTGQKSKVLVTGAKQDLVKIIQGAARDAGLTMDHIVPGMIGPVNAFESSMPKEFGEVVALVDIGFKSSTICLIQNGELVMNRVLTIGGDALTTGLAEAMSISYAEAESIKIGMPTEVQSNLEPLIVPLGRELRASIDFFEHQQDKVVSQVFVSGGSARSDFILQILRQELMKDCRTWNPVKSLQLALSPQKNDELEHVAPQLAVAVGGALTAL
jgi:type IV pilus assembly protein PilM